MVFAGFSLIISSLAQAQVITLRARIDAGQEVPSTTSAATGDGVMLYDLATNTFDLFVTLNNYPNAMTDSHVQEAAAGATGPALIHFGAESVFRRSGNTVTAEFRNRTYPGDKLKLLQNGAYLNFHTAQFPRGEVRGQLIAQPKRLTSTFTVAQEQAAFPATVITSNATGAAVMTFDPGLGRVSLRLSLFNFGNTLTNSHYHEGVPAVSGPVVTGLGNGTVVSYTNHGNGHWTGTFDLPYTGDTIRLLTGGAYLNFHSNVYPNGETRGQVFASDEVLATRVTNISTRGFVGAGAQVLIAGLSIVGAEPVRVLVSAKGPSLGVFGVQSPLADPMLVLYDSAGRQIAANDNLGVVPAGSDFSRIPGVPTNAAESALLVVLPPGNYTAMVASANGGTGIALREAVDLRTLGSALTN